MTGLKELLFHGITRFRVLSETSQSSCSKSCNQLLGHLPDGNSISEILDFYQDNMNQTEDYEAHAYLGVTYDFRREIWKSDFDESPFNDSYWYVIRTGC